MKMNKWAKIAICTTLPSLAWIFVAQDMTDMFSDEFRRGLWLYMTAVFCGLSYLVIRK